MRKTLWIALFSVCVLAANAQTGVYRYNVMYSFGFIRKEVGHAVVSIATNGSDFTGVLNGKSINWGGRIYTVRDTLRAVMHCTPYTPPVGITENVRFQIGWYAKPLAAELKMNRLCSPTPTITATLTDKGGLMRPAKQWKLLKFQATCWLCFTFSGTWISRLCIPIRSVRCLW